MKTLNCVVAFVVVLFVAFGSVVPADAQTTAERNAYASMDRAVQAAQANPTADRITAAQRAIRSAYNVFLRLEQQRAAADHALHSAGGQLPRDDQAAPQNAIRAASQLATLMGRSTAFYRTADLSVSALWEDHSVVWDERLRFARAGLYAIVVAATTLSSMAIDTLGATNYMVQRIVDAQGPIHEEIRYLVGSPGSGRTTGNANLLTPALSELVDAASAVANAMANRQREDVSNQQAFIEAERRREQEQQQAQIQEQQRQQERAEQLRTGRVTNLDEFNAALTAALWEARQAARAVSAAEYYEDAHPHHERGDAAVARARSLIAGNAGYAPTADYSQHHQILAQFTRDLNECPNKPRR